MAHFPNRRDFLSAAAGVGVLSTLGSRLACMVAATDVAPLWSDDAARHRLDELRQRIRGEVPARHELAPYFDESADILDRLITAIKDDRVSKDDYVRFDAQLECEEFAMLAGSLEKELELVATNAKLFAGAGKVINAREHGARGDGTDDDGPSLRKALASARQAGPGARLVIPAGRYAIDSLEGGAHLAIADCRDIAIEGQGEVMLVMKRVGTGMLVSGCHNVHIRHIQVDYDPLPYALGTIVAKDPQNSTFDMRLHAGYPDPASPPFLRASVLRGAVRIKETGHWFRKEGDLRVADAKKLPDGNYRLTMEDNARKTRPGMTEPFPIGGIFSVHARETPGGGCAVIVQDSAFVLLDAVNVYASYAHSYLAKACDGLKLLNCVTEPLPGRVACNDADGFHCPTNRKGPYLENCRILLTNDDCMNLYSKAYAVAQVEDANNVVLDVGPGGASGVAGTSAPGGEDGSVQSSVFRPGDLMVFLNPRTAEMQGFGRMKRISRKNWKNRMCVEITLDRPVNGLVSRDQLGKGHLAGREYVLSTVTGKDLDGPIEHFAVNSSAKGDGFVIRNCRLGDNRTAGIKFKASNGVMRGTTITGDFAACMFKIELNWLEGYFPRNILLQGNTLNTPRPTAFTIGAIARKPVDAARFIRHVVVESGSR